MSKFKTTTQTSKLNLIFEFCAVVLSFKLNIMFLLNKKYLGIDIADNAVFVVGLVKRWGKIKIYAYNKVELAPGVVEDGHIRKPRDLALILRNIFSEAWPNRINYPRIIFGLPKRHSYIHIFRIKKGDAKDLNKKAIEEAQSTFPIHFNDLSFDYRELEEEEVRRESPVIIAAANQKMVDEWCAFFKTYNFDLRGVDTETLASFRGVFPKQTSVPVCLLDIGAYYTSMSIFTEKGLHYSYNYKFGGHDITEKLAAEFKISAQEAEQKKINTGILAARDSGAAECIKGVIDEGLIGELEENLNYFEKKYKYKINSIVMLGGSSKMAGLADYIEFKTGRRARVGKPLIDKHLGPEFANAVGLALRGISREYDRRDPGLPIKKEYRTGFSLALALKRVFSLRVIDLVKILIFFVVLVNILLFFYLYANYLVHY